MSEQTVTPWAVEADDDIDYNKLVSSFGSQFLTPDLVARVEHVTGRRAHRFLRRGLVFSHRDLGRLLDLYENGIQFYLYSGRGPSSESLHLGHMIPFHFTVWLQKAFGAPAIIQLTDDEKFLFKPDMTLDRSHELGYENSKDIIACGFDPDKTFIFSDVDYIGQMYPTILRIQKALTLSSVRSIFGFVDSQNVGCYAFPANQAAPAFSSAFPIPLRNGQDMPCLVPCAIDQDAYFRMTRDVAPRMGLRKPALVHSKFVPGLQGRGTKMSASEHHTAIYMTDTSEQIAKKIARSFSGGRETIQLQRQYGADVHADVPFRYLTFFLEDDDLLDDIRRRYSTGQMLSKEVKEVSIRTLQEIVSNHQTSKETATDEVRRGFMSVRPLHF